MSTHYLENEILKISISSLGAELQNIYNKKTDVEYLWDGAAAWPKKSPILFPIVGGLKDTVYYFEDNQYSLSRHGFAREKDFVVEEATSIKIKFTFESDNETRSVFPFDFIFSIIYTIDENKLSCVYHIKNTSNQQMYFSVGAHPAFKIPLTTDTNYNDWFLEFEEKETTDLCQLDKDGLIKLETASFFDNTNILQLTKELFYKDALVFKDLKSTSVIIKSNKSTSGVKMNFEGFPYYGIWSAKDADFVCLEPWCGIADFENTNQQLADKIGINKIDSNEVFERKWIIEMF
ncbi:MAG: aldose 1-epimerase family protein [Chitinophagaceae bacterium]